MDNILIRTNCLPEWLVEKHFKNQDLISLEDLIAKIEDLSDDLENKTQQYENLLQDLHDNYKFVGQDYYEEEY